MPTYKKINCPSVQPAKALIKQTLPELAARVAHDIRSPLAAMEIGLSLIENNPITMDFSIIRAAMQRVREIANNLLDQYKQEHTKELLLLYPLIHEAVLLKKQEWLMKHCKLTFVFNANRVAARIYGIENEMKRVLSNLLNNAFEACQHKPAPKIKISVEMFNQTLLIKISDNGTGADPEKISDYLSGKSSKPKGTGLGLSSAKQYMENMGGKLIFSSSIGKGVTISLEFFNNSAYSS